MTKIKKLSYFDLEEINILISNEKVNFKFFSKLGWNLKSISDHLKKENNYSIGYFIKNKLCGFLLGELIKGFENNDLDVHIMYISVDQRRNKIGTKIINYFDNLKTATKISRIHIEVSENNKEAVKFYEKNNFVFFKFRHNYYIEKNKSINAKCYLKYLRHE